MAKGEGGDRDKRHLAGLGGWVERGGPALAPDRGMVANVFP